MSPSFRKILDTRVFIHIGIGNPEFSPQAEDFVFGVVLFDILIPFVEVNQQCFIEIEYLVSPDGNTTFDIVDFVVLGKSKNHDIFPLWFWAFDQVSIVEEIRQQRNFKPGQMRCRDAIAELFGKEKISDQQSPLHRPAGNNKRLRDKENQKENDNNRSRPGTGKVDQFA
jgi:hypothetical protein